MTDDLQERLRAVHPRITPAPDLHAIRVRATTLTRRRRIGTGAVVSAVAVTAVLGLNATTEPNTVVETEVSSPTSTDLSPADETSPTNDISPPDTQPNTHDWSDRLATADAVLQDGRDGFLILETADLVHLLADGTQAPIELETPDAFTVAHTLTDLAEINNVPHLLINRFINREDETAPHHRDFLDILYAPAASLPDLVETFNERHDVALELPTEFDTAQTARAALIDQWNQLFPPNIDVSILAVDLTTHEIIEVEHRTLTNTLSPDWFENSHITTDGQHLLVMRELWQGSCHFVHGLTLDGSIVDVPAAATYPRPTHLDTLTPAELQLLQETPPMDCYHAIDRLEPGLIELGRASTDPDFDTFAAAFSDTFN